MNHVAAKVLKLICLCTPLCITLELEQSASWCLDCPEDLQFVNGWYSDEIFLTLAIVMEAVSKNKLILLPILPLEKTMILIGTLATCFC